MTLNQVYNGNSIDEVVELLGKYGKEAKIVAGGTDIVIALKNEKISPRVLIDITKIDELKKIEDDGEYITLGAGVTFTQIVENDIFHGNLRGLYKACRMVGSPQIRNKGTIGGNIANGSAAADSIPPLIALGSIVSLVSSDGVREIPLEDYYYDQVRDNELLRSIRFKKPKDNQVLNFSKLGLRKALAISRLTTAVLLEFDENNIIQFVRAASGALGKYPMREIEVEEYLLGKKIKNETIDGAVDALQIAMDERLKGRSTLPYKRTAIVSILRETLESGNESKNEVGAW
ncbi:FAD binding domain-containing protein [Tissierella sp.]|uniref:FAD binding domain-containing protein n=1 Tax=Tissierella sp. TaxID=41274 RepID=UPI00285D4335|nr:FAD binding domain-containing protein [Tissierella sp.]MDR7855631.1 FAD binding domain-containing protein [Tissierella sp.]